MLSNHGQDIGILNAFSPGAAHGLQEPRVSLPSDTGRLEQPGRFTQLSRRELAPERISRVSLVEGTPVVEPNLA